MIHGLISLLYNGLLQGTCTALHRTAPYILPSSTQDENRERGVANQNLREGEKSEKAIETESERQRERQSDRDRREKRERKRERNLPGDESRKQFCTNTGDTKENTPFQSGRTKHI